MSSPEQWTAVDDYFGNLLHADDAALTQALADSTAAGLPQIQVAPNQGKFLHLLARSMAARKILEIGTLGGYSTIWLARALGADGHLITLELERKHAEVARHNIARAGIKAKVDLLLGPAISTLPQLVADKRGPFDLIFIDADKASIADYFAWAMKLSRPGTLIIVDNVVRAGTVTIAGKDASVQGIRRLTEVLSNDKRVSATVMQTVGSKGYDGFLIALVNEP